MKIVQKEIMIRFNTPAFLGDAEQKGRWRTPPFKALLRQWWRVVAAKDFEYDYRKLRKQEGVLFGHAWLKEGPANRAKTWAMKSQVQVTLNEWKPGVLNSVMNSGKVCHPEVNNERLPKCSNNRPGRLIETNLYLGFGSVGTKGLSHPPAIGTNESATLTIAFPDIYEADINQALNLIQLFGTTGGRSRNGWGSVVLGDSYIVDQNELLAVNHIENLPSRKINDCLKLDWPHAIGRDDNEQLFLWRTEPYDSWQNAMKDLAETKIAFRTALPFTGRARSIDKRHFIAYPITNHSIQEWGSDSRLANQLRFKVLSLSNGQLIGIAYHLPCGLPKELMDKLSPQDKNLVSIQNQLQVWKIVHQTLDGRMTRIQGG